MNPAAESMSAEGMTRKARQFIGVPCQGLFFAVLLMTTISVTPTLKVHGLGNASSIICTMEAMAMRNDSRAEQISYLLDNFQETTSSDLLDFSPSHHGTPTPKDEFPQKCVEAWMEGSSCKESAQMVEILQRRNTQSNENTTKWHVPTELTFQIRSTLTRYERMPRRDYRINSVCLSRNSLRTGLDSQRIFPKCSNGMNWMLPSLTHDPIKSFAALLVDPEGTHVVLHIKSSIVVQSCCVWNQILQKKSSQSETISIMKNMACPQYRNSEKQSINVVGARPIYNLDNNCQVFAFERTFLVNNVGSGDAKEVLSTNGSHELTIPLCFQNHQVPESVDLLLPRMLALTMLWLGFAYSHLVPEAWTHVKDCPCDFVAEQDFHCFVFRRLSMRSTGFRIVQPKFGSHRTLPNCLRCLFGWTILMICLVCHQSSMACTDIRDQVSEFNSCLGYDADSSTFSMTCDFAWGTNDTNKCIVLHKNETFEGNGHSINLDGVTNWEGLFRIATSNENDGPSSLDDAPVIHDVHMIGGETSVTGGFIIQAEQKHFIIKHCSLSGVIQGQDSGPWYGGGGICGHGCSGDILITHCWSTGEIQGYSAGGIAGRELGIDGDTDNTVTISHCYSTGDIVGENSGGICGHRTGANNKGMVIIKQCYSLGEVGGRGSGGITGAGTAYTSGHVSIINCYSRGDITGSGHAGGICGYSAGLIGGTVILTNVYASGKIAGANARGLIGHIQSNANEINVTMSVYNGDTGDMIGGSYDADNKEKNSGHLGDITGTVYCYNDDSGGGEQKEYCWDNQTIWQAVKDHFPVLIQKAAAITPTATPTSHPTSSISPTVARTASQTGSLSSSGTPSTSSTRAITSTETNSPTEMRTKIPHETPSPSAIPTNKRKREQMELQVQYPPRSVIMKRKVAKNEKNKT